MERIYHEAICRFQLDDIVTLHEGEDRFKIEEICLIQLVRANKMEFRFMLRNTANGELNTEWTPYHLMGEIIQYGNGDKPITK